MPEKEDFLSVIIPAYNEESRIEAPLPKIIDYCSSHFQRWELIYANDGSTDRTSEVLNEIQKHYSNIRIINNTKNEGKGSAVRNGMRSAAGNLILFSDTDFSTPIEEIEKLQQKIEEGYDIAIGSRGLPDSNIEVHQNFLREEMGKIFNTVLRSLLPIDFLDTQCGFKLFRDSAVQKILPKLSINGFAFDVEILIIAQTQNLRIAEVPVVWRNVLESKVHPVRNSLEMLRDVLRIRHKLLMNLYS
jgi:dolichyl-phosphate beta-glucosyltransferase